MAITRDQKAVMLEDLNDKFSRAKGIVFAQNSGLSVENAQELRRGLRASNVDYKVAKKTLIRLAAKNAGYDVTDDVLEGSIGVAFGFDDEIVAAQSVSGFAKKFPTLKMMGGVMEGKVIDANIVAQLAEIPSRDVLLAKFLGSAMSPLTGFVGIGNALVGGFVRVVNAYQEQRVAGGEAAPEAPAEEAKSEESAPEAPAEEAKSEESAPKAPAEEAKSEESAPEAPAEEA
jgi:large subunit ribosomal protein L10